MCGGTESRVVSIQLSIDYNAIVSPWLLQVLRIWIGQQTGESIVLYTPCGSTYNLVSPLYIWFYCMHYSLS